MKKIEYYLSDMAKSYIAGLLTHSREISLVVAQWVNSYKRLVPGYEAPVYISWARRNRSALIRVPMYKPGKANATRMEFRCPDPACNPYLAFAALMMAGLDGVKKSLDPTALGYGPLEKNLYDLPKEELDKIKSFPPSLDIALSALEADNDYLTKGNVIPKSLLDLWVSSKRQDIEEMRVVPHPWEVARYYDI